ncbi:hypothetical protein [Sphingomonas sp. PAMC 26605]|uniref:hypothetical protein n=1 Tax=Sphingomonas sp. PAMC 26605 TaxID=1112214 RepID=UPI0002E53475|nr:hypothetical protein [Sphingomonas sp. PAMC 26605]
MTATQLAAKWNDHGAAAAGVLVIADAATAPTAAEAVAAAHGRLLARVGWDEARARFDQQGTVAIVLAEAAGVDDALLDPVLPLLDRLARNNDIRIVAAFDPNQIDVIAGVLTAPGVDLLCAPTQADRVVALCLAGCRHDDSVQDVVRENEATRLRRFHEEVARIAETLARLTRDGAAPQIEQGFGPGVEEPTMAYRATPADLGRVEFAARDIRQAIRARRLRDQHFGAGLFEDPAWDMLLDLFAAELERAQVSVSSLCIAAAVAPTTALRWIARMTEAGLFERRPDPFDRRRAFMGLSRRASTGMRAYFAMLRAAGMAIA